MYIFQSGHIYLGTKSLQIELTYFFTHIKLSTTSNNSETEYFTSIGIHEQSFILHRDPRRVTYPQSGSTNSDLSSIGIYEQ